MSGWRLFGHLLRRSFVLGEPTPSVAAPRFVSWRSRRSPDGASPARACKLETLVSCLFKLPTGERRSTSEWRPVVGNRKLHPDFKIRVELVARGSDDDTEGRLARGKINKREYNGETT